MALPLLALLPRLLTMGARLGNLSSPGQGVYIPQLRVEVTGFKEAFAALDGFSERRINAALATALTRTALRGRDDLRDVMRAQFDNPRPYTINGIVSKSATALRLQSEVLVREDGPVARYLMPQVTGGPRAPKPFERLATGFGLPSGWVTTPGPGAELDQFGNMRRAQLRAVLSQLSGTAQASRRKGALRYFVIPPGKGAAPGVYAGARNSRQIRLVLAFVRVATYDVRLRFHDEARRSAERHLPIEMRRAFDQAVARFRATRSS